MLLLSLTGNDSVNLSCDAGGYGSCRSDEFMCSHPRRCITQRWVCDLDSDCEDGSDEADCRMSALLSLFRRVVAVTLMSVLSRWFCSCKASHWQPACEKSCFFLRRLCHTCGHELNNKKTNEISDVNKALGTKAKDRCHIAKAKDLRYQGQIQELRFQGHELKITRPRT